MKKTKAAKKHCSQSRGTGLSAAELAAKLGVATRTIERYRKECEDAPAGRDLAEWALWLLARERKRNEAMSADEATVRKAMADAQLAEIKVAEKQHQVVSIEQHEATLDAKCAAFAAILLRLPADLAPKVAGASLAEARRTLTTWARQQRAAAFGAME